MGVNLIFKIAAVGTSGFRHLPGVKAQRKGENRRFNQPGGPGAGAFLDGTVHI